MPGLLIYLLITVLVLGAIAYAIQQLLPEGPFKNVAYVILVVFFIVVLIQLLPGGFGPYRYP